MPERTFAGRPTTVVIGASAAGLFAAAALAEFTDVTLIDRDTMPQGPEPRRGVPQAHHAHLVWGGGVAAVNNLLPGLVDEAVASGARLVPIMGGMVSRAPTEVWFRRYTSTHHRNLVCSRPLFDHVLRERVLRDPQVHLLQNTTALGLEGDAAAVTGVRVKNGAGESVLRADLVVDASGRGSRAPDWLKELGLPAAEVREVDAGVAYATRRFKAPGRTSGMQFPLINVQANPAKPPGRGGIILPVENGRWIVTLSGTRGGEPSGAADSFIDFALGLGDPMIGELLKEAEPDGGVVTSRSTANRRHYFERMPRWPDGFVVLGDAIAGYNPVYGHGLTVAAQCAVAARDVLRSAGLTAHGTAMRVQRAAARPVGAAWDLAVGQDALYPGATDTPPTLVQRLLARYVDSCVKTGAANYRALGALLDVMSMERSPARLFSMDMLWPMLVGRKQELLAGPPLRDDERDAVVSGPK
ncbi:NAD(P)/FAD-dependent oxidoreductase [Streptomyces sp. NPDC050535]|uniref:NAD(P)/FAD-dependent oxidoreductase n=1 Tax=Streptomyces sp. NPDC050535 TaxID=3365626 RepID=UPI0037B55E6E